MTELVSSPSVVSGSGACCQRCQKALEDRYFDVSGLRSCGECVAKVQRMLDGNGRLGRFFNAALLGTAAALLAGAGYWLFMALTDMEFALVTIGMGWLVGTAVRRGSGGKGGWHYGLLAVLLTYLSLGLSYTGVGMSQMKDEIAQVSSGLVNKKAPAAGSKTTMTPDGAVMTLIDNSSDTAGHSADPELPKWAYLIIVPIVMLVMPVFVCFQHILSAVIIGFGLWQAWKMNRAVPLTISGPYPV